METKHYWEDGQSVKYDNYNSNDGFGRVNGDQLNFAAPSEDEADYPPGSFIKKGKVSRQDPMSHRIIEKRRRDRMNNCLADLSRLIPPEYLKKGRGRVEKTEIIEMAIRHLKYLQDRANAEQRTGEEHFRAGFQEAVSEAVRFLVEVHGYGPGDGLCMQLASHLQRHCESVTKGDVPLPEKPAHSLPNSSSEPNSSSNSSHGYTPKQGVIQVPHAPAFQADYDPERQDYSMECDRASSSALGSGEGEMEEPLPLDGRRHREPSLRDIRKPEQSEDLLHSYKFKNCIERRFSRSQDEAAEVARGVYSQNKVYTHKRRRGPKLAASTSTSGSGSTEDTRDTSPQDTSSESPQHHHYEKPPPTTQYVPIFALSSHGKYYIPLSVDYACLLRYLRPYDALDGPATHLTTPLHPVTIHVNFQPCINYHVKREPANGEWRPA